MPLIAADPDAATATRAPIQLLSPSEVARIKAGEVVDRPASVVKELIENALDAGATRIGVELEDGGKQLIRVTDDGCGIPSVQLPLAVQAHATSKIRGLDDLGTLSTLGFRGEGLAAIATVSELTFMSRSADEALGARLSASGDERDYDVEALAMQPGTVAEVRNLFGNVPARLKFLRNAQSETSQIATLLSGYALAYPEVRFTLTSSGRTLLRSDGDGDGLSVLADLCGVSSGGHRAAGRSLSDAHAGGTVAAATRSPFAPIAFDFPPMAVTGWISEPRLHRHNRSRQWFFVNRRPVNNKLLFRAVDDSVREFMSEGKYPQGAFFLDLPAAEIDVNVHPMKLEVSFAQPQAVYTLLTTAIRRALGSAAATRQRELTDGLAAVVEPYRSTQAIDDRRNGASDSANGVLRTDLLDLDTPQAMNTAWTPPLTEPVPAGHVAVPVFESNTVLVTDERGSTTEDIESGEKGATTPEHGDPPSGMASSPPSPVSSVFSVVNDSSLPDTAPQVNAVQQVANAYLALLTPEAVYLVDQHAAHERILFESLYERLQVDSDAHAPLRQRLLFPLTFQLSPGEALLAEDCVEALGRFGFVCGYDEDSRGLQVSEVPLMLAGRVTAQLLHGALAELAEADNSALIAGLGKQLAASLACRAAIKAGERLPQSEQQALVAQLLARWSSLSCPHGRPTILRLGSGELEGLFLR